MDLIRAKQELMKDGWLVVDEERSPYFLVKGEYKLDIDFDLTKLYWNFKGYDTVTFIPVKKGMSYKQFVKVIKDLIDEIEDLRW